MHTGPVADHICVETVDVLFSSLRKAGVDAALLCVSLEPWKRRTKTALP